MEFRPCIDIHNGKVKQIVGSSLKDEGDHAKENFVSEQDGAFFARLYQSLGIRGGHIILLNHKDSEYYDATRRQAYLALETYPGGLQVGGGITPENAVDYLDRGASHVIVTSYVFANGRVDTEALRRMEQAVGKDRLVLDLSCRSRDGQYYVVTDRWQKFTEVVLNEETLDYFADHCDEMLIHAVDVEGKNSGVEADVCSLMGNWGKIPVTYAGGVHNMADLEQIRTLGKNRVNVTIGSALKLFGGTLELDEILKVCRS